MLSIEDRTAWLKAETKARQVRPHVKMITFGKYEVAASDPAKAPYTVTFERTSTGHWAASCTCPAHIGDGKHPDYKPKACYHVPSAYAAHRIQVNIHKQLRASTEEAPATGPACSVCGESANAWTGSEWLCWAHVIERAEDEDRANAIEAEAELDDVREMEYTDEQETYDRECLFG